MEAEARTLEMMTWRFLKAVLIYFAATTAAHAQAAGTKNLDGTAPASYTYGFYVQVPGARDLLAEAAAAASPKLKLYRIASTAEFKSWTGTGQPVVSFDSGRIDVAAARKLVNWEGDAAFPTTRTPVSIIYMQIIARPERDLVAYAEALDAAIAVSKALKATLIYDQELDGNVPPEDFEGWVHHGQVNAVKAFATPRQNNHVDLVGPDNPPDIGLSGPVFQSLGEGRVVTRGMRKYGLPDVLLGRFVPGVSPYWLVSAVANVLAAGRAPDADTGRLAIRASDAGVRIQVMGRTMREPEAHLRLAPAKGYQSPTGNRVLEIGFEGATEHSVFERQMQLATTVFADFKGLANDDAYALSRAIGRARAKITELAGKRAQLKADGTKVFIAYRNDSEIKTIHDGGQIPRDDWRQDWREVVSWPDDAKGFMYRRWSGDPRKGGAVYRLDPPQKIDDETFYFQDSTGDFGDVDDILIVDKNGKADGAETEVLLKTLFAKVTPKQ
jgi:hypothetical protein